MGWLVAVLIGLLASAPGLEARKQIVGNAFQYALPGGGSTTFVKGPVYSNHIDSILAGRAQQLSFPSEINGGGTIFHYAPHGSFPVQASVARPAVQVVHSRPVVGVAQRVTGVVAHGVYQPHPVVHRQAFQPGHNVHFVGSRPTVVHRGPSATTTVVSQPTLVRFPAPSGVITRIPLPVLNGRQPVVGQTVLSPPVATPTVHVTATQPSHVVVGPSAPSTRTVTHTVQPSLAPTFTVRVPVPGPLVTTSPVVSSPARVTVTTQPQFVTQPRVTVTSAQAPLRPVSPLVNYNAPGVAFRYSSLFGAPGLSRLPGPLPSVTRTVTSTPVVNVAATRVVAPVQTVPAVNVVSSGGSKVTTVPVRTLSFSGPTVTTTNGAPGQVVRLSAPATVTRLAPPAPPRLVLPGVTRIASPVQTVRLTSPVVSTNAAPAPLVTVSAPGSVVTRFTPPGSTRVTNAGFTRFTLPTVTRLASPVQSVNVATPVVTTNAVPAPAVTSVSTHSLTRVSGPAVAALNVPTVTRVVTPVQTVNVASPTVTRVSHPVQTVTRVAAPAPVVNVVAPAVTRFSSAPAQTVTVSEQRRRLPSTAVLIGKHAFILDYE